MASMHAFAASRLASASANELIASNGRQARPRGLARNPGARRRARHGCVGVSEVRAAFSSFPRLFPRPFSRLERKCADRFRVPRTQGAGTMATYEELKARVAMLKRADKEEVVSRKAIAAQEAAEVARCVRVPRSRRGGRNAVSASDSSTALRVPSDPDRARPTAASHRLRSLVTRHVRATGPRLSCCLARRRTTRVWRTRANPWTRRRLGRRRCASSTRKRRNGPVWRSSA